MAVETYSFQLIIYFLSIENDKIRKIHKNKWANYFELEIHKKIYFQILDVITIFVFCCNSKTSNCRYLKFIHHMFT